MISNFALQDTGRKLIVHKTLRRRLWRLLNMLCTINLRPVSTGLGNYCHMKLLLWCFSGFKQLSAFQKKRIVLVNFHVFLYPSNIYLFNINSRNTRNMFTVNDIDTKTAPLMSLRCFYCWPWTFFTPFSVFVLLILRIYLSPRTMASNCFTKGSKKFRVWH